THLESPLEPEADPFLKKLKRLIFETLPTFLDAFEMAEDNPLKNYDMLEEEFMNVYIHPVLKKALARFAGNRYVPGNKAIIASGYRKLVTRQKGNADRADGIAYTSDESSYEISVTEGSKPYPVDYKKEISDYIQNGRAGKDLLNFVVISEVKLKRKLPTQFRSYMVQCFGLNLRFYFMDYL
ncbi:7751_t:CDS:2, partial [Paraglomus occultum]